MSTPHNGELTVGSASAVSSNGRGAITVTACPRSTNKLVKADHLRWGGDNSGQNEWVNSIIRTR
ncbi:hypothetical protein GCM10027417_27610 [Glutamicibacter endophyticus]